MNLRLFLGDLAECGVVQIDETSKSADLCCDAVNLLADRVQSIFKRRRGSVHRVDAADHGAQICQDGLLLELREAIHLFEFTHQCFLEEHRG